VNRWLKPHSETLYAVLRIVAGFLFACHGAQKLFGWFGGFGGRPGATAALGSLPGIAGIIEFFGGALIALGLATTPVAFIASGEMAVAYFRAHFPSAFWPLQNRGELPALYCFLFLYVAARGAGPFSIDAMRRGRLR